MKQTIVKFIDYDVDGCGTEINSMITFNAELTEKQKNETSTTDESNKRH